MTNRLARMAVATALMLWFVTGHASPTTFYTDRTAFLDAVRQSFTDTFSDYGATVGTAVQLSDAAMQAVKGETRFEPLSLPGLNLVTDYSLRPGEFGYCAGCNGNFKLWFDDTSLTIAGGVFGVALDVLLHTSRRASIGDDPTANPTFPSEILVEFANGQTTSIVVPADVGYYNTETYFFGITDARRIRSLTVGTESMADRHSWLIDNLTIATQVPEPATSALMLVGLASLGFMARRHKHRRQS
jgi:PEP-CTERM motif